MSSRASDHMGGRFGMLLLRRSPRSLDRAGVAPTVNNDKLDANRSRLTRVQSLHCHNLNAIVLGFANLHSQHACLNDGIVAKALQSWPAQMSSTAKSCANGSMHATWSTSRPHRQPGRMHLSAGLTVQAIARQPFAATNS